MPSTRLFKAKPQTGRRCAPLRVLQAALAPRSSRRCRGDASCVWSRRHCVLPVLTRPSHWCLNRSTCPVCSECCAPSVRLSSSDPILGPVSALSAQQMMLSSFMQRM
eukprot:365338-Chlamydomonas_euryale.AAC.3